MTCDAVELPVVDAWRLGADYVGAGRTRFLAWAPGAATVSVRLVGRQPRSIALAPQPRGYHAAEALDCYPGEPYWLVVDGRELPDPASRYQPDGVFGPSAVVDLVFDWDDAHYHARPFDEYVIYELHVGAFTRGGTLDDIALQLDRLVALGVTAIQLMPLAQCSGARNWGYDGVFPFAVQNNYGGPDALRRLVEACHARQLAVILDVVYNHLGPEGACLAEFGPYFSAQSGTPWGPAINFDGPQSAEVRRYFLENARQWLVDFRIDALRLDAVHAIRDDSPRPFLAELTGLCDQLSAQLGRPIITIAECNWNDPRLLDPRSGGGSGLTAQYLDDFQRALHALLTSERIGHYADYGSLGHLSDAINEGFVLHGQYSHYRRRPHGASSVRIAPQQFVAYAENHDTVGNRADGARLSCLVDFDSLKLAAAVLLLSPYPPQLFMGEEYGEMAPFLYFVDHRSPALLQVVREGRQRDFVEYLGTRDSPDPASPATFAASWLDAAQADSARHAVLWRYYQRLLALRREWPLLRQARRGQATATVSGNRQCLIVDYQAEVTHLVALFNFGDLPLALDDLIAGPARVAVLLNSADPNWDAAAAATAAGAAIAAAAPIDLRSSDCVRLDRRASILLRL